MRLGYTGWTWLLDQYNDFRPMSPYGKRDFESSLRELADLRYEVFENFNIIVDLFEDSPDEFEQLCQRYGMKFVNIYHYLTDDFDADMVMAERCCRFLNRHNATKMNLEAPRIVYEAATDEDLAEITQQLTRMGRLARDHGVDLCIHPHCQTTVFLEHEIDHVVRTVDADLLSLCMDTAHTQMAGMDPIRVFEKFFGRTKVVHLKDLDPSFPKDDPPRGFRALGEGVVDVKGVLAKLRELRYEGDLIVEMDHQRICNYETAMVSREYAHRVLSL